VQLKRRPTTTYMESVQTDINPMMRSILLDWLVEVGMEYRLTSDTLFLSAAYIDRFLSLVDVKRNRLQLVGVTAMLVASKYEEIWAPEVRDFVYISDRAYTRDQILNMEKIMLNSLRFNLTVPSEWWRGDRQGGGCGWALVCWAAWVAGCGVLSSACACLPACHISPATGQQSHST